MKQHQDSKTTEQALLKQAGLEISRHKAIVDKCSKLFKTLEDNHTEEGLNVISSIPHDLRKISGGLQRALDEWSKGLAQTAEASNESVDLRLDSGNTVTWRRQISRLKSELNETKIRLAERETQIGGLLSAGLLLAFKKEELEKRLLTSRA